MFIDLSTQIVETWLEKVRSFYKIFYLKKIIEVYLSNKTIGTGTTIKQFAESNDLKNKIHEILLTPKINKFLKKRGIQYC